MVDRERLRRIRNWQSREFYAALVIRPLTIAVMLVVADWRWLTPNRVTTLSNLAKLAAAAMILVGEPAWWIAAAAVLQVGLLLDHLDGTIARYRGTGTGFGSVYDKLSDAVTWFAITAAIGWVAYDESGKAHLLLLAAASAYALLAMGYSKWVLQAEAEKLAWKRAARDPGALAARVTPVAPEPPPERSAGDWLRWIGWKLVQVVRFDEVDLFFWVGLGLILGELELLIWLLAITQVAGALGTLLWRLWRARQIDRESVSGV
jgi:phosphatidylglycerophosphate synthase